jgi:hypothetical protein
MAVAVAPRPRHALEHFGRGAILSVLAARCPRLFPRELEGRRVAFVGGPHRWPGRVAHHGDIARGALGKYPFPCRRACVGDLIELDELPLSAACWPNCARDCVVVSGRSSRSCSGRSCRRLPADRFGRRGVCAGGARRARDCHASAAVRLSRPNFIRPVCDPLAGLYGRPTSPRLGRMATLTGPWLLRSRSAPRRSRIAGLRALSSDSKNDSNDCPRARYKRIKRSRLHKL